jgi:hypothetical protein
MVRKFVVAAAVTLAVAGTAYAAAPVRLLMKP